MTETKFDRRAIPDGAEFDVQTAADGWPLRVFDWPVAATEQRRGSILFQGGRGDMVEKYLETFAHFHSQGWHITSFDWRGQGGSGRLTADQRVGHVSDFAVWIDDLADFWTAWTARTEGPHITMGHSMGGHLLLRAIAEKRIKPSRAALIAPMLGFESDLLPVKLLGLLVGMAAAVRPERRAWRDNERPAPPGTLRQSFLTHDNERYADELWWKAQHPELELGPPSLNWLAQAHHSTAQLEHSPALAEVTAPVLMLGTLGDKLVSPVAIQRVAGRMPNATLHMFDRGVAHEILREVDAVRDEALGVIDTFMARS